jgi:hypothetical protein
MIFAVLVAIAIVAPLSAHAEEGGSGFMERFRVDNQSVDGL